jgi:hypothetical protein
MAAAPLVSLFHAPGFAGDRRFLLNFIGSGVPEIKNQSGNSGLLMRLDICLFDARLNERSERLKRHELCGS